MSRQRSLIPSACSRRRARAGDGARVHQPGLSSDARDHERLVDKQPVRHVVHFAVRHRLRQERRGCRARSGCAARRARCRRARVRCARLSGSSPCPYFSFTYAFLVDFRPSAGRFSRCKVCCILHCLFLSPVSQTMHIARIIKWSERSLVHDSKRMHLTSFRNSAGCRARDGKEQIESSSGPTRSQCQ
jgi:hypothetical protein